MKATDYSNVLKIINRRDSIESVYTNPLLPAHGFYMEDSLRSEFEQKINSLNTCLMKCFKALEERCKFLEDDLADAHRIIGNQRSNDIYQRDKVERAKALLKEHSSKNGELDAKIAESEAALATLNQELEAITQTKADLIAGMNDPQKNFVLEKARSNDDTVIIDLVLATGFDEGSYLALHGHAQDESQLAGEHDEAVDVFDSHI